MTDEITPLREEVALLRAELKELRLEHRKLLRMVGVLPLDKGEEWPEYLDVEASCVALRNDRMQIPIIMRGEDAEGSITFMDKNRRTRIDIVCDESGPRFEMYNAEGKLIFQIAEAADGSGQACACDPDGRPRAGLRVNEKGGVVNVIDTAGKPQAFLIGTPTGGEIFTVNAMHNASATMKATSAGGMVCVHESSGQLMGFLSANTETGGLSIYGPHGAIAAGLIAGETGGAIIFNDVDGEPKATLP
jgi:hypothetical protein